MQKIDLLYAWIHFNITIYKMNIIEQIKQGKYEYYSKK